MPSQDKLPVLARVLRVDPHALLYGSQESLSAAEQRRAWEDGVTYAERQTIDAFLHLPTPQRLIVRDVINAFAQVYGMVDPGRK